MLADGSLSTGPAPASSAVFARPRACGLKSWLLVALAALVALCSLQASAADAQPAALHRLQVTTLPAVGLVRPGRATLVKPEVGAVNAVVEAADGTVWFGGEEGLQQYDGIRLAPLVRLNRGDTGASSSASGDPVRAVRFLLSRGNSLYFNAGATLMAWRTDGTSFKAAAADGSGWAPVKAPSPCPV